MALVRKKFTVGTSTLVVPAGIKHLRAVGCGAGGGGGGGAIGTSGRAGAAGSGGGGAPSQEFELVVVPGETLTIVVGAGGVGGSTTVPTTPTAGATSTITGSSSGLIATFASGGPGAQNTTGANNMPGGRFKANPNGDQTQKGAPGMGGSSLQAAVTARAGYSNLTNLNSGVTSVRMGATGALIGGVVSGEGTGGGGGGWGPFGDPGGIGGAGGSVASSGFGGAGAVGNVGTGFGSGGGGGGAGGEGSTPGAGAAGAAGAPGVVYIEWQE